jgi:hypothetical protein
MNGRFNPFEKKKSGEHLSIQDDSKAGRPCPSAHEGPLLSEL